MLSMVLCKNTNILVNYNHIIYGNYIYIMYNSTVKNALHVINIRILL